MARYGVGRIYMPSACVVVLFTCCGCSDLFGPSFDSTEWRRTVETRHLLVPELQKRLLPGKSEAEIIALLGEPKRRYSADEILIPVPGEAFYLDYSLSMELPGVFDRSSFVIALDENKSYVMSEIVAN